MSLPQLGNLTGPIGIVLTPGNVYKVEGSISVYGSANVLSAGATASVTVRFAPGDFVEIASSNAY